LSYVHTAPGSYSEVFLDIVGPPNTRVAATLRGPGIDLLPPQAEGTTAADGKLRLAWRIFQFGAYQVTGSVGSTTFNDSIAVK
jgi:hypothetical protein